MKIFTSLALLCCVSTSAFAQTPPSASDFRFIGTVHETNETSHLDKSGVVKLNGFVLAAVRRTLPLTGAQLPNGMRYVTTTLSYTFQCEQGLMLLNGMWRYNLAMEEVEANSQINSRFEHPKAGSIGEAEMRAACDEVRKR